MNTTSPASSPPRRRWIAFSIRGVLAFILVLALWLGWLVHQARQRREAVAAVKQFGGWVHYDYEFAPGPVVVPEGNNLWMTSWGKLTPGRTPWASPWLRRSLGDEYFTKIAHVSLFVDIQKGQASAAPYGKTAEDVLAKLATQSSVRTLQIGGRHATDQGMESVGQMTGLEELIIFPAREITDDGVAHLGKLRNLRIILLSQAKLTDAGLRTLGSLPNLEEIMVDGQGFSDEGLTALRGLAHLKVLSLGGGQDRVTEVGRRKLQALLPNLTTLK